MIENRSAPGAMSANLGYDDLEEAIAWLCETFGFVERFRYGPPDQIAGAQLQLGDAIVMLFGPGIGHGAAENFRRRAPLREEASHTVTIRVEDVDAHHDHARTCGARVLLPPTTHHFGERQYSVVDCAGHLWCFSQSMQDVHPKDWGATLGAALQ
jgi:uncharacterized glyoxalase superfamily protein PhnB